VAALLIGGPEQVSIAIYFHPHFCQTFVLIPDFLTCRNINLKSADEIKQSFVNQDLFSRSY